MKFGELFARIKNLSQKIRFWLRYTWLIIFYRFLLYPLLGIVQTHFLDIQFLNFGFKEELLDEDSDALLNNPRLERTCINRVLNNADFPNDLHGKALRAHCCLYERTLALHPFYPDGLDGKHLLEVGCGLGGGLRWLCRAHPELETIYGIDPYPPRSTPKGTYVCSGRAEHLAFEDNAFDLLINVESSHCYGKQEANFFREAFRVLKPAGHLCWADIRTQEEFSHTITMAKMTGLQLVAEPEIVNAQVLRGMRLTSARYETLLKEVEPKSNPNLRNAFEFEGPLVGASFWAKPANLIFSWPEWL